jgi:glyoxylase-like metal-dependent hydrolase (beta-lactamase superfamily II)
MGLTQHGSNLFLISRNNVFNCYLIREDDGLTLIDSMIPGSATTILEAVRAVGAPIRRILLTHPHHDHVGSLDAIHEQLPDVEVLISDREARIMAGDRSPAPNEPQNELRGEFIPCKARPTRLLVSGQRIGSLEVISLSGHTPGHTSFLDMRDGTLIAGDAYANLSQLIVSGVFTPLFPISAKVTWHKSRALESAKRLRDLQPSRLALGHGPVLENPVSAMTRAIEASQENHQIEPNASTNHF